MCGVNWTRGTSQDGLSLVCFNEKREVWKRPSIKCESMRLNPRGYWALVCLPLVSPQHLQHLIWMGLENLSLLCQVGTVREFTGVYFHNTYLNLIFNTWFYWMDYCSGSKRAHVLSRRESGLCCRNMQPLRHTCLEENAGNLRPSTHHNQSQGEITFDL